MEMLVINLRKFTIVINLRKFTHDQIMLTVEFWKSKMVFSVRHKDLCTMACNKHVAIQLVSLVLTAHIREFFFA